MCSSFGDPGVMSQTIDRLNRELSHHRGTCGCRDTVRVLTKQLEAQKMLNRKLRLLLEQERKKNGRRI